ncbi:hypothetical protein NDU88_001240 [Pleurodeles waltl]|uniref:Uncharacterized protein n=1 Tax=Pleurodeles waltl TaxID=8319 RepID=A0AAV7U9L5_PLEWA|nr:hypothetical protein NDU88_001240 [Pleurodeles waltl]
MEMSPTVRSDRSKKKKRAGTSMQGTNADRRKGVPTPAQVRLGQRQALSAAIALWHEDRQTAQQPTSRRQTDSEYEASISKTSSEDLPEVTLQTAETLI